MCESGTADDVIVVEDRDAVRIIRMNRPTKLNALDTRLTRGLYEALRRADEVGSVRAVVLAGEGRSFCAGADLAEFADLTPQNLAAVLARAELTVRTQMMLQHLTKPIISVVQGAAIGGGAGLAIGCDMMVAATDLKFGYPELNHSIVPALVMTGLQRQIGRKLAFEMISTGRLIAATEAHQLGLANRVVEPEDSLDVGLQIATSWARLNPLAMAATKELFYRVADLPFDAAMRAGRDVNVIMRGFRVTK